MKKPFICLVLLALLGCVSIQISPLPSITDQENTAEVTIERKDMWIWGIAMTHYFSVNGKIVRALEIDGKFTFQIDPGEYLFGVTFRDGRNYVLFVKLESNHKYLFYTKPVLNGVVIEAGKLEISSDK